MLVAEAGPAGRQYRLLELVRSFAQHQLDHHNERESIEEARANWVRWYLTSSCGKGANPIPRWLSGSAAITRPALRWVEARDPDSWVSLALEGREGAELLLPAHRSTCPGSTGPGSGRPE